LESVGGTGSPFKIGALRGRKTVGAIMTRTIVATLCVISVVASAGCWSAPKMTWKNARLIQAGMTTNEVTQLIGKPYSVIAVSETKQRRVWVSLEGFTYATKSLSIDFENGKVIAPPPIPDEFKD
jgi:hypothetical protein